jgi:hypothetical protein
MTCSLSYSYNCLSSQRKKLSRLTLEYLESFVTYNLNLFHSNLQAAQNKIATNQIATCKTCKVIFRIYMKKTNKLGHFSNSKVL